MNRLSVYHWFKELWVPDLTFKSYFNIFIICYILCSFFSVIYLYFYIYICIYIILFIILFYYNLLFYLWNQFLNVTIWSHFIWFPVVLYLQVHAWIFLCQCHFFPIGIPFFTSLQSFLLMSGHCIILERRHILVWVSCTVLHCTPWPTKSPSTHSSSAICTLMQSLTSVITHSCIPKSANRNHTGNILDDSFHSVQNVTRMT